MHKFIIGDFTQWKGGVEYYNGVFPSQPVDFLCPAPAPPGGGAECCAATALLLQHHVQPHQILLRLPAGLGAGRWQRGWRAPEGRELHQRQPGGGRSL